jgi:DNA adenine methylase
MTETITGLKSPAKWVGRKARLMPAIAQYFPARFTKEPVPRFLDFKKGVGNFHDPFVGTGSAFLYFADGFKGDRQIFISDSNPDLINLWDCIMDEPLELLVELIPYKKPSANTADFFYAERETFNRASVEDCDKYERSAMMIYLIQACFNSLWRVNESGEMNTPFGDQGQIPLPTENDLVAIAALLQKATIKHQSFEESLKAVQPNDVVYLDPPYIEVKKNSFNKYTTKGFSKEQQILLRQEADLLHELGAYVYASNSDTPMSRELWDGWKIAELTRSGCMNSDATKRQRVGELLFYKR